MRLRGLGGGAVPLWHNFYRLTDPIGVPMFDGPNAARGHDHRLADPANQPARPADQDNYPPLEHDREPYADLAVHSHYLNEQTLKKEVSRLKDDFA